MKYEEKNSPSLDCERIELPAPTANSVNLSASFKMRHMDLILELSDLRNLNEASHHNEI